MKTGKQIISSKSLVVDYGKDIDVLFQMHKDKVPELYLMFKHHLDFLSKTLIWFIEYDNGDFHLFVENIQFKVSTNNKIYKKSTKLKSVSYIKKNKALYFQHLRLTHLSIYNINALPEPIKKYLVDKFPFLDNFINRSKHPVNRLSVTYLLRNKIKDMTELIMHEYGIKDTTIIYYLIRNNISKDRLRYFDFSKGICFDNEPSSLLDECLIFTKNILIDASLSKKQVKDYLKAQLTYYQTKIKNVLTEYGR